MKVRCNSLTIEKWHTILDVPKTFSVVDLSHCENVSILIFTKTFS